MDMDFRCPFTGDTYDLTAIIDDRIDIEHIIPQLKTLRLNGRLGSNIQRSKQMEK